jgi:hypothetical protein
VGQLAAAADTCEHHDLVRSNVALRESHLDCVHDAVIATSSAPSWLFWALEILSCDHLLTFLIVRGRTYGSD